MAGLYAPLPTLRRRPRGRLRTDRGRRGLLLLHRSGLSPHTPCQSPGALTRVAACTLARSPIWCPLSEGFSHFVTSMTAPIASGWSDCRVGFSPTGKRRLCTAHTLTRRRTSTEQDAEEWGRSQNQNAGMLCPVVGLDMDRDQSIWEFFLDGSFEPIADVVSGTHSLAARHHQM